MKDHLQTFGEVLETHARLIGDSMGARDLERTLTFSEWNDRSNRLANAIINLGLMKGDRIAVLAYNRLEWAEIYAATAKAGIIIVPLNFRLSSSEIKFIVEDCNASAVIAEERLLHLIDEIRDDLIIEEKNFISISDKSISSWENFESLIAASDAAKPIVAVNDTDPWALMYTSGTTGKPKGAIRSHKGMFFLSLVTEIEIGITRKDDALLVMPMCHANSLNFFCSFAYRGAAVTIYSRSSFDPQEALNVMEKNGSTFTSLVPTHYIMMLSCVSKEKRSRDLGKMTKLMISSAPARAETKRQIMEMFPNSGLYELYGSSEAGWVTMLHPDEQFSNLGTVGRECVGSAPIKILDDDGKEVPDGEIGELHSCTPYTFDGYWNLPEKTEDAFRANYCTVGDMALRNKDGFIKLIDRKKNMIISGGENIYPTEVESVLGRYPCIKDVAVIGLPDEKWGETVHAIVVCHSSDTCFSTDLIEWCEGKIARYKIPKNITFVDDNFIPRTATGKIQHNELKVKIQETLSDFKLNTLETAK